MRSSGEPFGRLPDGRPVERYTLAGDIEVTILTLGATIQSVRVEGVEVALGYGSVDEYLATTGYFGAAVGRVANRLAHARAPIDGVEHRFSANEPPHTLHGGADGFNRRLWSARPTDDGGVSFEMTSPDGDQGFPGTVRAGVRYTVSGADLRLDFEASTDRTTLVNLTSHAYWNLAGGGPVAGHIVEIAASRITPVDAELIPTGAIEDVAGTRFDFTTPRPAGAEPYDINFALDEADGTLRSAARLTDPVSGRALRVLTTQPGLQLFTGMPTGAALEAQAFPDAPNHPGFPSIVLQPGEEYRATTVFSFA